MSSTTRYEQEGEPARARQQVSTQARVLASSNEARDMSAKLRTAETPTDKRTETDTPVRARHADERSADKAPSGRRDMR